jgi:hypothetical protein
MLVVRSPKQRISPIVMPVIEPSDEHPVSARRHRPAARPLIRNRARDGDSDRDRRRAPQNEPQSTQLSTVSVGAR